MIKLMKGWRMSCFIFLLVCTMVGTVSTPASAHVLKIDGEISAILHINPYDHPVSGEPTQFLLMYGDTSGRFSTSLCACKVVIKESAKILNTQTLQPAYPFEDDGLFTFPKGDVYELILNGTPKRQNAFQPFTIDYLLRVDQGKPIPQPFPWLAVCAGIALVVATTTAIGSYFIYTKSHEKRKAAQ